MSNSHIVESTATGQEIADIVAGVQEALLGVPRGHAIIACLSMALILQNPDISPEQLQSGIKDVSRYVCLLLEGEETPLEKRMLN